MEYKGIKLTEVTGSQIVDPPKEMFVWDYDPGCLLRADVLAIVNGRENDKPVITKTGTYRHCAEIPEEPKPRRATNRELSKWLAKGHGEYTQMRKDRYHAFRLVCEFSLYLKYIKKFLQNFKMKLI